MINAILSVWMLKAYAVFIFLEVCLTPEADSEVVAQNETAVVSKRDLARNIRVGLNFVEARDILKEVLSYEYASILSMVCWPAYMAGWM